MPRYSSCVPWPFGHNCVSWVCLIRPFVSWQRTLPRTVLPLLTATRISKNKRVGTCCITLSWLVFLFFFFNKHYSMENLYSNFVSTEGKADDVKYRHIYLHSLQISKIPLACFQNSWNFVDWSESAIALWVSQLLNLRSNLPFPCRNSRG
jgi:hypothetical protein